MATNGNKILAKTSNKFYCEYCDYGTSKSFNLDVHNNTKKHKVNILATNFTPHLKGGAICFLGGYKGL